MFLLLHCIKNHLSRRCFDLNISYHLFLSGLSILTYLSSDSSGEVSMRDEVVFLDIHIGLLALGIWIGTDSGFLQKFILSWIAVFCEPVIPSLNYTLLSKGLQPTHAAVIGTVCTEQPLKRLPNMQTWVVMGRLKPTWRCFPHRQLLHASWGSENRLAWWKPEPTAYSPHTISRWSEECQREEPHWAIVAVGHCLGHIATYPHTSIPIPTLSHQGENGHL